MRNTNQNTFGFIKNIIVYCPSCKLKFNKTNSNDINFHNKLHKSSVPSKSIYIGDCLYQNKENFYLIISSKILAQCSGKISKNTFFIKSKSFVSERFKHMLYSRLQAIFENIKNYW